MRVRTGHGPQDWSDQGEGFARVSGHGGELARPAPSPTTHKAIGRRIVPVDPNDYAKAHRWEGKPRCGVIMKLAKEPCGRMPGHKDDHRSAYVIAADLERRRGRVA